jgi:DNA polymerase III alpha subunit (gram-positive type)
MKYLAPFVMLLMTSTVYSQVANDADGNFDSTTYVETNGTTTSTSNVTSNNTNTNTNVNTNTSTSNNTNTNTNNNILSGGTNNTNTNINTNTSTSNNTNTNNNFSTSTSNNTNTNNNFSTSTSNNTNTNNNNNTVQSTSTAVNTNNNTNNTTSNNTNTNISESVSESVATTTNTNNNVNENRNVSESTQTQNINQKIESPPPSAIAPSIGSSYSQDLCTTGVSGAVQTQIFGISGGKSITDTNCERIKLSKTMYDMGMRVAAVALMCQDDRVWTAMKMAGTPCPYEGMIGDEAGVAWEENLADIPGIKERDVERGRVTESPNRPR